MLGRIRRTRPTCPRDLTRKLEDAASSPIPPHGGYRKPCTFQIAVAAYEATGVFCDRSVGERLQTREQTGQAARSCVQNIVEGSMASATSKKTELELTGVARAGLKELLRDYEDFLRQRGLRRWERVSPEAMAVRERYREERSHGCEIGSEASWPSETEAPTLSFRLSFPGSQTWQRHSEGEPRACTPKLAIHLSGVA